MLHSDYVSFTVAEILHIISNKLSHKCFMLVITPAESFNTVNSKFFKFIPLNKKRDTVSLQKKMVQEMDAVQLWYLDLFAT